MPVFYPNGGFVSTRSVTRPTFGIKHDAATLVSCDICRLASDFIEDIYMWQIIADTMLEL